ncbi:MAG: LamG domain-containing protein [Candidatus Marsarchaeota archaeon]|jgi:hypothetical protein|nr:LamG domain-containing protein [Candidatus Marsarchaeota archaeon]
MQIIKNYKNKSNCKKIKNKKSAQSAMEYLMTYGWAILIIAVILVVLFHMGVFNTSIGLKASPGSCNVNRPYGPGTIRYISVQGASCNKEPEYVATLTTNSYITAPLPLLNNSVSVFTWVNTDGYIYSSFRVPVVMNNRISLYLWDNNHQAYNILAMVWNTAGVNSIEFGSSINNIFIKVGWHQIGFTYNNSSIVIYVDGAQAASEKFTGGILQNTNPISIGGDWNAWFNGSISNVQIYNTSLSTNDIQALYQKGIGGAPIDLDHLVGWWPLNGNANDYSGNGYNSTLVSGVSYYSSWENTYTPP